LSVGKQSKRPQNICFNENFTLAMVSFVFKNGELKRNKRYVERERKSVGLFYACERYKIKNNVSYKFIFHCFYTSAIHDVPNPKAFMFVPKQQKMVIFALPAFIDPIPTKVSYICDK
jgi:hypothetical protein